ncbi:MAG TPA: DNA polymerase IV [Mariprofundaceae bacterium]|nr:DNA polymerase IV [Mariprofundaceae bacterium]
MIPAAWPAAIAHIDADCFYASCELLRRPELRGKPVCVLSSQDACIVAKTYDAKAAGINTGMAVWEARKKLPDAVYIPADFRFYGLVSHKMFAILRRFTPIVEQYSIDEAFADLYGLRSFWHLGYDGLADAIRGTVKREAGITVSIGVSVSRTLAKMASDANKPDGSKIVSGHDIGAFLQGQSVRDIPGIGGNRTALLHKFGIHSAFDFSRAPESLIRRLLGRGGFDLWRELNGQRVFDIEHQPRLPKSMARTASLGLRTSDPRMVRAHLSRHCFRLGMDMLAQGIVARRFTVMLRLGSFERVYQEVRLPQTTGNLLTIQRTAGEALGRLLKTGMLVNACGIVATEIEPACSRQQELFADKADAKMLPLWQAVHTARRQFGSPILRPARSLEVVQRQPAVRFRYPLLRAC